MLSDSDTPGPHLIEWDGLCVRWCPMQCKVCNALSQKENLAHKYITKVDVLASCAVPFLLHAVLLADEGAPHQSSTALREGPPTVAGGHAAARPW